MNRHELREAVFKNIFQIPFYENDKPEMELPEINLEEEFKVSEKDQEYIDSKVADIVLHIKEIDKTIEESSHGWKVKRIGKSELAILRLAIYEIKFDDDIPERVAINEAIELAKAYTDSKASGFINGVLAGVMKSGK